MRSPFHTGARDRRDIARGPLGPRQDGRNPIPRQGFARTALTRAMTPEMNTVGLGGLQRQEEKRRRQGTEEQGDRQRERGAGRSTGTEEDGGRGANLLS